MFRNKNFQVEKNSPQRLKKTLEGKRKKPIQNLSSPWLTYCKRSIFDMGKIQPTYYKLLIFDMDRFWHLVWANLTSCKFSLFVFFLIPLYIFLIYGVSINKVLQCFMIKIQNLLLQSNTKLLLFWNMERVYSLSCRCNAQDCPKFPSWERDHLGQVGGVRGWIFVAILNLVLVFFCLGFPAYLALQKDCDFDAIELCGWW